MPRLSPPCSRKDPRLELHVFSIFSPAFSRCSPKDPGLLAVARGCPKLEKLMLTGCGSITGKSVRALARGCVALRDLSLSGCGGVGNSDLRELAKGCKGLRHLNIAECAQVRYEGFRVEEACVARRVLSKIVFSSPVIDGVRWMQVQ